MITKDQIRGALGLLDMTVQDLSKVDGLPSRNAISTFLRVDGSGMRSGNLEKIEVELERRGIEFLGNYGVQFKRGKT